MALWLRRHVEEMSARLGDSFDVGAALAKYNEEVGRKARNKMDPPVPRPPATPLSQRTPQAAGQQTVQPKGGDKGQGKGHQYCT